MNRRGRVFRSVLIGLLVIGTASACAAVSSGDPAPVCLPGFVVTPDPARPGETVTLGVRDGCVVSVPADGWQVELVRAGGGMAVASAVSHAATDDDFRVDLDIPADAVPGDYEVQLANGDYGPCSRGGGSCAAASAPVTVVP